MIPILLPAIWLVVLLVGLPQLSETVYTPSLPDIAHYLRASGSLVEFTLTIYLLGFALGTLFWGKLSDKLGRKPCILAGILIFIIGCIGCYFSRTIEMLMISRFIQAFGGSIGSVLAQALCRDAFHGPALGKAYSSVGSALALFPAIGPVIGGLISQHYGWQAIFLFLIGFALILMVLTAAKLPETHPKENRKQISVVEIAFQLMKDKNVIGFGLIVAACNGIAFSYFAEGSFYLIKSLGLTPAAYGFSFVAIALATMLGGIASKRLHNNYSSFAIMGQGIWVIVGATTLFSIIALIHHTFPLSTEVMIIVTLLSQMSIMFGSCMSTSNALALALVDYKWCIGTASSLFGFFYYAIISLVTFGMGALHNGSLLPMPLYFLGIALFMLVIRFCMNRDKEDATTANTSIK